MQQGCKVRLFSDGGLREGLATWSALAVVQVGVFWRLAVAGAGRLPPGTTVPEAELVGAAQAWELEAALRERATGSADRPIVTEEGTRQLGTVEVFHLETLAIVQWAELEGE